VLREQLGASAPAKARRGGRPSAAMRIVGGRHRGRAIRVPPGHDVRPTADRAREALFNVLVHADFGGDGTSPISDAKGCSMPSPDSGALGLEALSRGARRLTCLELAAERAGRSPPTPAALGEMRA